ncbi:MAG: RNA polymerase sigma-70 factor [Marinifilaceae bacterium]
MFKQHFKQLCFYGMTYLNDIEVAKDIVHDVFAEVWTRRVTLDFKQPLYPYLLRLTRNRCINHLEHIKVRDKYVEVELIFGSEMHEHSYTEHDEMIQRVMARIDKLPAKSREVVNLYFLERKKYKEIAEELGISVNTVKTHMTTGMRTLRSELGELNLYFLFFGPLD